MKFRLPSLHKKSSPSPSISSLCHPSEPTDASASSSSGTPAGLPSPFGGKETDQVGQKAFPRRERAEPQVSSDTLSSYEIGELQEAFNVFDANHDGKISAEELGFVLRSLGEPASEQELIRMVRDADRDGDGFIDLNEFLLLHSASAGNRMNGDQELKEAFRFFDADKNGFISVEELHDVLKRLRRKCSVEECRKMIKGVDIDGDGQVSFEEFQKMMS